MTELVVTSWSGEGGRLYGHRFMKGFRKYWPESVSLVLYADTPSVYPRCEVRYTGDIPDWAALRQRWQRDLSVHGWATKEQPRDKAYSYVWDAARFAVKVFVMRDAAERMQSGTLTWLDGDTVTCNRVPVGWTSSLLEQADVAYLGRHKMHPETGYLGFRVPQALPLLRWCCDEYLSERFRQRRDGWTDCHVFRAGLKAVPVRAVNLTAASYTGKPDVWPVSPLGRYLEHLKGRQRKLNPDGVSSAEAVAV